MHLLSHSLKKQQHLLNPFYHFKSTNRNQNQNHMIHSRAFFPHQAPATFICFKLLAHFRVAVCLGFKVSPGAQPFKWEWSSGVFSCKSNSLSFEWLSTRTRFESEANSNSVIVLHERHSAQQRRKTTKFESFSLYFYCETGRTDLFLGYAHIVRRIRHGLTATNLR